MERLTLIATFPRRRYLPDILAREYMGFRDTPNTKAIRAEEFWESGLKDDI